MLEKWFQLSANGTSVKREITAGLTTFAALSYILAVNPSILKDAGMDFGALVTATALASAIMTAAMALATNYPIALAPGMGMNAFFTYTICIAHKVPWNAALAMVFLSGLLFMVLTIGGIRRRIIEAIPHEMKIAITCGIGLFIAFIGLQKGGIIAGSPATMVTVGKLSAPQPQLVLLGIVVSAILIWRKIRGGIILTILGLAAAGLVVSAPDGSGPLTRLPEQVVAMPESLAPTFLKLDLAAVFNNLLQWYPLILAILFVDLFDNMGTLIGVASRAGLLDRSGNLPRLGRALAADASAAMVGSCLGTSTVTSYIESAAGVEEGGRTGLTALTVSVCFLLALFFHPVIRMIPDFATAPALVIVGVLMMQGATELDWKDFSKAAPAVLTMFLMPLTFSISEGLTIGFLVYVALQVGIGRARNITPVGYMLAGLFLLHLITR